MKIERLLRTTYDSKFGDFKACEKHWKQDEFSSEEHVKMAIKSCFEVIQLTRQIDDETLTWEYCEARLNEGKVIEDMFNFYRVVNDLPKCPRCGSSIIPGREALSRRDNKTFICSDCGMKEAFEDLEQCRYD